MKNITLKDESTLRSALSILYNINKAIDVLESIGINIEDGEGNIGKYVYGSSTETYFIVEKCFENIEPSDELVIAEIIEDLYNGIETKEEAIDRVVEALKTKFGLLED